MSREAMHYCTYARGGENRSGYAIEPVFCEEGVVTPNGVTTPSPLFYFKYVPAPTNMSVHPTRWMKVNLSEGTFLFGFGHL